MSKRQRVTFFRRSGHPLVMLAALVMLTACIDQSPRQPLPVVNAPKRQTSQEIPPDGIIAVKAGDTIYTIANRYGVTPRKIILGNKLTPPYALDGIDRLELPKARNHRIAAGDTIDSISARYAVSKSDLIRINQLKKPYHLRPGTSIVIPRALDYSMLDFPEPQSSAASRNTSGKAAPRPPQPTAKGPIIAGAPDFGWPVRGEVISRFGILAQGVQNDGISIAATHGEAVGVSYDGTVAFIGRDLKAFGNMVLIKHENGWITAYAHLDSVDVTEGQHVTKGDMIGRVGQTGKVEQPQLHFQIRLSRQPVDPIRYMS